MRYIQCTIFKIILFLAVLGLPCYAGFSLVVVSGGYSVVVVYRLLSAVALRHVHSELWRPGSRAQAQYFPDYGIEPMSPALAGGFFYTEPPGKSYIFYFFFRYIF